VGTDVNVHLEDEPGFCHPPTGRPTFSFPGAAPAPGSGRLLTGVVALPLTVGLLLVGTAIFVRNMRRDRPEPEVPGLPRDESRDRLGERVQVCQSLLEGSMNQGVVHFFVEVHEPVPESRKRP